MLKNWFKGWTKKMTPRALQFITVLQLTTVLQFPYSSIKKEINNCLQFTFYLQFSCSISGNFFFFFEQ